MIKQKLATILLISILVVSSCSKKSEIVNRESSDLSETLQEAPPTTVTSNSELTIPIPDNAPVYYHTWAPGLTAMSFTQYYNNIQSWGYSQMVLPQFAVYNANTVILRTRRTMNQNEWGNTDACTSVTLAQMYSTMEETFLNRTVDTGPGDILNGEQIMNSWLDSPVENLVSKYYLINRYWPGKSNCNTPNPGLQAWCGLDMLYDYGLPDNIYHPTLTNKCVAPSSLANTAAASRKISGVYRLSSLKNIRDAIMLGFPVYLKLKGIGSISYHNAWNASTTLSDISNSLPGISEHSVSIIGYRTNPDGSYDYLTQNTMGDRSKMWDIYNNEAGCLWVTTNALNQMNNIERLELFTFTPNNSQFLTTNPNKGHANGYYKDNNQSTWNTRVVYCNKTFPPDADLRGFIITAPSDWYQYNPGAYQDGGVRTYEVFREYEPSGWYKLGMRLRSYYGLYNTFTVSLSVCVVGNQGGYYYINSDMTL